MSRIDALFCQTDAFSRCFLCFTHFFSTSILWRAADKVSIVADIWEILFLWQLFFLPRQCPSLLFLLLMIPVEVNSRSGPLSSDTLFARIRDDGYMDLYYQLDSGFSSAVFIVKYFSCNTLFAWIGYDAVMTRDYWLGGGSGGAAFTVTSFSGENSYSWFGDDSGIARGCWLDDGMSSDLEHATKFWERILKEYWWISRGKG